MAQLENANWKISGLSLNQLNLLKDGPDTDKLQSYINEIQKIKNEDYSNYDFGVFEGTAYLDYANTLTNVKASQAALLLSTQGLTNAQIAETLAFKEGNTSKAYQAMVEAGLLKSKQSLTRAELQNILASKTCNEEYAKAIMNHMGLSVAIKSEETKTVKLTSKKLQELMETKLLTQAQAQEIAMITGVSLAKKTQANSVMPKWLATLKASTLAIREQVKATAIWLATTPAGWVTAAITAVVSFAAGLSLLKKKQSETIEKIRESAETAQTSIDSMNSAFEDTKAKAESAIKVYERLAGGIDLLTNKNLSLSDDDYEEFLDTSNALASAFPQLVRYYDANGNAILNLGDHAAEAAEKINALADAQKQQRYSWKTA